MDVGTISVRLLVGDVEDGAINPVERAAEITHLGEGLIRGSALGQSAMERTEKAAQKFVRRALELGAEQVLVVGTSAVRDAADGRSFLEAIAAGQEVSSVVLTGGAEARLAFVGATRDLKGRDALVLDIGGGSTEVIWQSAEAGFVARSFPLGASRCTEALHSDPPDPRELAEVRERASELLRPLGASLRGMQEPPRLLVGVAGTVTTLTCLELGLARYDPGLIHGQTLTSPQVTRLVDRLGGMTLHKRAALPCMQAGRAEVIVAGAVILSAVMECLGYSELRVSEHDLLDGALLSTELWPSVRACDGTR